MTIKIPEKLSMLFRPKRYKIAVGGRGGYKTITFSNALLLLGVEGTKKVLCAREYMSSIKNSVHATLKQQIRELGLEDFYDIKDSYIEGKNGTIFNFIGLSRNARAVKSYQGYNILWLEEADNVTEQSFQDAVFTIREAGSEIWASFNPGDENAYIYSKYVKPHIKEIQKKGHYEDERLYVVQTSLEDNPFPCEVLREESRDLKEKNFKRWMHVFGGEPYGNYDDAIIQPEWVDAAIDAHIKLGFRALGVKSLGFDPADTGDAKALVQRHGSVITNGKLWDDGELPDAIDIAFEKVREWESEEFVYDDDGLGASVKVYISKVNIGERIRVSPYNGNGAKENPTQPYPKNIIVRPGDPPAKTNKEYFKNKRAQYYRYLADRFEATYNAVEKGIYTDPDDMISLSSDLEHLDVLKSELIKIKRVKGNNTFYQIQSKKDAMSEGIKSPNYADALKMSFANPPVRVAIQKLIFDSEF